MPFAVRLMNTSSFPFRLAGGQLIGEARTAISPNSGPLRADRVRPERPQAQNGSDRIGPDQIGSNRIGPDKAGSSQTDAEPVEVEPVDRHGVPDDRGYPSVGELQPTWTSERLAELQKADPDVAIIREWLEAGARISKNKLDSA